MAAFLELVPQLLWPGRLCPCRAPGRPLAFPDDPADEVGPLEDRRAAEQPEPDEREPPLPLLDPLDPGGFLGGLGLITEAVVDVSEPWLPELREPKVPSAPSIAIGTPPPESADVHEDAAPLLDAEVIWLYMPRLPPRLEFAEEPAY